MMSNIIYLLTCIIYLFADVYSDYDCLCNNNTSKNVYPSASQQDKPIELLNKFECKPVVSKTTDLNNNNWIKIAFAHRIGYVLQDVHTKVLPCWGQPSREDRITTIKPTTSATTMKLTSAPTTMKPTMAATTMKLTTTSTTMKPSTTATTMKPKTTATTVKQTTTATTMKPTTTATTTEPTTTSRKMISTTSTGRQVVCPLAVKQHAQQEGGTLFINSYDRTCYELVPHKRTWISAENDCVSKGGHLVTIGNLKDEEVVYKYVKSYTHAVWIGLHDRNNEETFEWSSGEPVVYLRWHAGRKNPFLHRIEDCVAMGPQTGTWEDMDCLDRYSYICEFDAVNGDRDNFQSTAPTHTGSYTDGNTANCPSSVKLAASRDNGVLGLYGRSCYELLSHSKVSWEHGESMCKSRGGHLAHINSAEEQGFIQSFMTRHLPQHSVWIGLHDTRVEGQMEWTSGSTITYTNWVPGHLGNFESFRTEDCVAFIPYKNGQWDDIPCGDQLAFFGDIGETHPILCQYAIMTSSTIVG